MTSAPGLPDPHAGQRPEPVAPELWDPPPDLSEFLATGAPPVFIGFGSMSSTDANADVRLMMAAARRAGRRAVIRLPHGADHPADPPRDVYPLREAPYRWLFPRMAAVIHHGGAGTTAEALLAGVPNAAVAFGGDQPYYGRRVIARVIAQYLHQTALPVCQPRGSPTTTYRQHYGSGVGG